MDKLVISSDELASVCEAHPSVLGTAQPATPLPWALRILLVPLVFLLPILSFTTIIIWILTLRKEPCVRHAWMQYCCALLVISGLVSSFVAACAFFMITAPAPAPTGPFALDTQLELPDSVSAELLSPSDLANRVERLVFIVSRESKWLKPRKTALSFSGFGTGVLLFAGENEFLFVTSRHVIDGDAWQHSSPFSGDALLWDRNGGFSRAQIVGRHKNLDLMLLRIPRMAGTSVFVQQVLNFENITPGERIMVFGHPEGLFFSLSDGLVSRKEPSGRIQITAPVSPGASGGPVYDLRGRLLGIVSGMMDKRRSPNSENLNFAVRADSLLHPEQWHLEPLGKTVLEKFIAASAKYSDATDSPSPNPITTYAQH
jgi:S1-C subfamily serine protease